MTSKIDKCIKNIDKCDIALVKISSAAFILFLITVWPAAMDLVHRIHWGWFLAVSLILMLKPFMKYFKA